MTSLTLGHLRMIQMLNILHIYIIYIYIILIWLSATMLYILAQGSQRQPASQLHWYVAARRTPTFNSSGRLSEQMLQVWNGRYRQDTYVFTTHHKRKFMANPCEPFLSTTPLAAGDFKLLWLKHVKTIINHPPVITIFIGGINHFQSWVVYGIVLTTLLAIPFGEDDLERDPDMSRLHWVQNLFAHVVTSWYANNALKDSKWCFTRKNQGLPRLATCE